VKAGRGMKVPSAQPEKVIYVMGVVKMKKIKAIRYDLEGNYIVNTNDNYVQVVLPDGRLGFGKTKQEAINNASGQTTQILELGVRKK